MKQMLHIRKNAKLIGTKRLTYRHIYDSIFFSKNKNEKIMMWMKLFARRPCPLLLRHMSVLFETQSVTNMIDWKPVQEEAEILLEKRRLAASNVIKANVLKWLWRPGNRLSSMKMAHFYESAQLLS